MFDLLGQPKDVAAIDEACRGMDILDVYRWLFGFLRPDQFLLDKTPAYANDGDTLRRSRPLKPHYIWLIRHPLGVIESHVRLKFRERHTKDLKGIGWFAQWIRSRDQVLLTPLLRREYWRERSHHGDALIASGATLCQQPRSCLRHS